MSSCPASQSFRKALAVVLEPWPGENFLTMVMQKSFTPHCSMNIASLWIWNMSLHWEYQGSGRCKGKLSFNLCKYEPYYISRYHVCSSTRAKARPTLQDKELKCKWSMARRSLSQIRPLPYMVLPLTSAFFYLVQVQVGTSTLFLSASRTNQ